MSPEDRREAIAEAVLPLLAEHGVAVTTSQIAEAAGIAEGTVFRVFKDKQELLGYCVQAALRVEPLLEKLQEIPRTSDLRALLKAVADTLSGHFRRTGALLHALASSGWRPERPSPGEEQEWHRKRLDQTRRITESVAEILSAEADRLRVPPKTVAGMFLGLVFTDEMGRRAFGETAPASTDELIDVFLHGVLAR
ncbi:transcriptional regulator, TetR family [Streptoalloteichus tenebrarius]|uniref:Transcriptional regulator, TetR family n=2 Tax=Streptoalloteichus tenebrarius (strain ATCC 17920 / DSM 40477 / JCM 4838 / CBS 697.72 / NBRC 16177 / NCIMB 11028 / NRRL B-12390 / A12253. 1 / ISP 5477) TaxID=1933 RepID=A0ABT1HWD6_STRSD|nr:transcriptional regulator, TetR family [Streptoalloteichus tenebrarius]BFF00726.1 TetR/AcrR family transcriptional regulator [Streptoalloteichus tenebrarius]